MLRAMSIKLIAEVISYLALKVTGNGHGGLLTSLLIKGASSLKS